MPIPVQPNTHQSPCEGYCRACDAVHQLGSGAAKIHAEALMRELAAGNHSRVAAPAHDPIPGREPRGQMFGVLECRDHHGNSVILRAFSALLDGQREAEGWVPPLLSAADHRQLVLPQERAIKELTAQLDALPPDSPAATELRDRRRGASRKLFDEIQKRYCLQNFRSQSASLAEAWTGSPGIPGGVGDCCAPKLLCHAAQNHLTPIGIAEFFWGDATPSGSRQHGQFYPACANKCQPILGFILCGLS